MQYKHLNDYELLYFIKENDDDAREKMLVKYSPVIKKLALKYYPIISSSVEFDDFLQEGYVALDKAFLKYDEYSSNLFYTFAIKCIERRFMNYCRDNLTKKQEILSDSLSIDYNELYDYFADSSQNIEYLALRRDFQEKIKLFLLDLDFTDSLIFELKYNSFTYKEISQLLDISVMTVDKSLYRIKNSLRKSFGNYI